MTVCKVYKSEPMLYVFGTTAYSSPHFPHQCLWTANMESYIRFNYFI